MKQKSLKITQNTLFVYKSAVNRNPDMSTSKTEPTLTTITTLTGTSGRFNK